MLSLIIASVHPHLLQRVKQNAEETIGLPYEFIVFNNSSGEKGICEIYNQGIAMAKGSILCFMHEDIAFVTKDWGKTVQGLFEQNAKLGIVGIAGGTYKPLMPSGWYSQGSPQTERSNLIQSFKFEERETHHANINPTGESLAKVVAVDGVWMCVKKEVTRCFLFDSATFKNFHCYDIDFCLSAGKAYDIAVTYDVLIHHFSEGNFNRQWMDQTMLLYKKWEGELPKSVHGFTKKQITKIEKQNFRFWLKQIHALGYSKDLAYWLLHRPKFYQVLGLKYFLKFHYSIINTYHLKKNRKQH